MIRDILFFLVLTVFATLSLGGVIYEGEVTHAVEIKAEREAAADARRERDKARRLLEQVFNVDDVGELVTWSIPVTVSAYTAREEECDSSPETTADMTPSRIGLLAVSRDLLEIMGLRYGETVMLVDGGHTLGLFTIRDTMHPRWTYRVDILHGNLKAARLFGVKKGVDLVRVLDYGKRG